MMLPTPIRSTALLLSFLGATLLQACSTTDQGAYFNAYEREYKKRVDYQTHFVIRNGLKIHVREYGSGHPGPTYVMMHGFPDSMHLYDRLVPLLSANRHIITFDFIGWGDSDKPEHHRYDVASLYQDLAAVVAAFNLQRIVPVVHDASGQAGIDWALDHPGKTAGLVLLNTYYGPMPTLKAPEAIERFSTPGLLRDISVLATRHFDTLWLSGYKQQIGRFIHSDALRERFQTLLGYQSLQIRPAFYGLNRVLREEVGKRKERTQQLMRFEPPVLILFGEKDPYLNPGVAREFHKLFPNAELHLIEKAGHFVQIDQPERIAALLRDFPKGYDSHHEERE